jgi:hypothetical protein
VWHRRENQAANGENKPQPVVSGETGLLDSNTFQLWNLARTKIIDSASNPFNPENDLKARSERND